MKRPQLIEVIRAGERTRIVIDGQDLPYLGPRDAPVVVSVAPDDIPTVTLTLMADQVNVINALREGGSDGTQWT